MPTFPFYRQFDRMDCGPTCLRMIAHYYGKLYSQDFLRDKTSIGRNGVSVAGIAEAAEIIGLQSLSVATQLIRGMQEIRLNGSEKRRRWEWESIQIKLFKISIKGLALAQTQNTGGSFLNELKNILITFFTAKAVIDGQMTLGTMLSIQYIIGQLNLPISNFISFVQTTQDAKISLDRLNEIYDKADEEPVQESFIRELPQDKGIHVKNVNFRYGSRESALILDNLSLDIPAEKVTAIVGASGSGKTTLIKLLLQFHQITEGGIYIGKTPLKNISPKFWRSECGCVMQEGYIFADSIVRNITESDSEGGDQLKIRLFEAHQNLMNKLSEWEQTYVIKAPTEGSLSYFNFWSENQNVKQGDEIFSLIPKNQTEIIGKVLLSTQRAGKLKIGQKAIIKLDNFPFAEFGVVEGTVKHISAVPKQNQYAVEIDFNNQLTTNTGTAITAKNDIQGSVDIVTEDLRLIERVFYQIRKLFV